MKHSARNPRPGDPATMLLLSDRKPATVVEIDEGHLVVQEDRVVAVPGGIPRFEQTTLGRRYRFQMFESRWRQVQASGFLMPAGAELLVGRRDYYRDPAFLGQVA